MQAPNKFPVSPGTVMVIDDELQLLATLERILKKAGFEVLRFSNPIEALAMLEKNPVDAVLTDIRMPAMDGIELCKEIKKRSPEVEVVVMTGVGTIEVAINAMKAGAYDFLSKPFDSLDVIPLTMTKAIQRKRLLHRNRYLENQIDLSSRFENLVGESAKMKAVFHMIEKVSPTDVTVLITGESGTGKELVAKAIYEKGTRSGAPFFAVNCSAFNENLLESELFGHVKGAFTGASSHHKGLLEEAHGGTLFLDEVGDAPLPTQVKLLRVLQEGEIKPVGSNEIKKVDVRLIAATNVDLAHAMKEGTFREDLFYRLNVITIPLPALRERSEDIPLLVHHFLGKHTKQLKKEISGLSSEAQAALMSYRWPGNVRELENTIERAIVMAQNGQIGVEDLPEGMRVHPDSKNAFATQSLDTPYQDAKHKAVSDFDLRYLEDVMARAGGVIAEAARLAGMDRSNFRRLLTQYNIDSTKYKHG